MNPIARILVIDDEREIRTLIVKVLSRAGYEVQTAVDGKEGVKLYRESPSDLVITDLIMPNQEGIETIIQLRRDFPEVKIIAISGGNKYRSEPNLTNAVALGAKRALAKPFNIEELLEAVRDVLEIPAA